MVRWPPESCTVLHGAVNDVSNQTPDWMSRPDPGHYLEAASGFGLSCVQQMGCCRGHKVRVWLSLKREESPEPALEVLAYMAARS